MLTLPNLLTLYRIAAAPVAIWMALDGQRDAFFVLIIISLITDLVDGPIARSIGQVSAPGARLDTMADSFTTLAAIFGIFIFEGHNLWPDSLWLGLFLATYSAAAVTALAKFRVLPAYHLYLSKTAAFAAGLFFIWLYLAGFSRPFFLGVLGLGVLANIESLATTLLLKTFRTDIASVISVLGRGRDDGTGDG